MIKVVNRIFPASAGGLDFKSIGPLHTFDDVEHKLNAVADYYADRDMMQRGNRHRLKAVFKEAWKISNERDRDKMKNSQEMIAACSELFYRLTVQTNEWMEISEEYSVKVHSGLDRRRDITFIKEGEIYSAVLSARRLNQDTPILVINLKRLNNDSVMQFRIGCDMCYGKRNQSKAGRNPHLDIADIVDKSDSGQKNNWVQHIGLTQLWKDGRRMGRFINYVFDQTIPAKANVISRNEQLKATSLSVPILEPVFLGKQNQFAWAG